MSTKTESKGTRPAGKSQRTAAEVEAGVKPLKARQGEQRATVDAALPAAREAVTGLLKADASLKAGKARVVGALTASLGEAHLSVSRAVIGLKQAGVPASAGAEEVKGEAPTIADVLTQASTAEGGGKPRRRFSATHVTHYINLSPRVDQVARAVAVVHARVDAATPETVDSATVAPIPVDGHVVMTIKPAAERGHWEDMVRGFTAAYTTACRQAADDGDERPDWQEVWKKVAKTSKIKTLGDKARALMDEINAVDPAQVKAHRGALEGLSRALEEVL